MKYKKYLTMFLAGTMTFSSAVPVTALAEEPIVESETEETGDEVDSYSLTEVDEETVEPTVYYIPVTTNTNTGLKQTVETDGSVLVKEYADGETVDIYVDVVTYSSGTMTSECTNLLCNEEEGTKKDGYYIFKIEKGAESVELKGNIARSMNGASLGESVETATYTFDWTKKTSCTPVITTENGTVTITAPEGASIRYATGNGNPITGSVYNDTFTPDGMGKVTVKAVALFTKYGVVSDTAEQKVNVGVPAGTYKANFTMTEDVGTYFGGVLDTATPVKVVSNGSVMDIYLKMSPDNIENISVDGDASIETAMTDDSGITWVRISGISADAESVTLAAMGFLKATLTFDWNSAQAYSVAVPQIAVADEVGLGETASVTISADNGTTIYYAVVEGEEEPEEYTSYTEGFELSGYLQEKTIYAYAVDESGLKSEIDDETVAFIIKNGDYDVTATLTENGNYTLIGSSLSMKNSKVMARVKGEDTYIYLISNNPFTCSYVAADEEEVSIEFGEDDIVAYGNAGTCGYTLKVPTGTETIKISMNAMGILTSSGTLELNMKAAKTADEIAAPTILSADKVGLNSRVQVKFSDYDGSVVYYTTDDDVADKDIVTDGNIYTNNATIYVGGDNKDITIRAVAVHPSGETSAVVSKEVKFALQEGYYDVPVALYYEDIDVSMLALKDSEAAKAVAKVDTDGKAEIYLEMNSDWMMDFTDTKGEIAAEETSGVIYKVKDVEAGTESLTVDAASNVGFSFKGAQLKFDWSNAAKYIGGINPKTPAVTVEKATATVGEDVKVTISTNEPYTKLYWGTTVVNNSLKGFKEYDPKEGLTVTKDTAGSLSLRAVAVDVYGNLSTAQVVVITFNESVEDDDDNTGGGNTGGGNTGDDNTGDDNTEDVVYEAPTITVSKENARPYEEVTVELKVPDGAERVIYTTNNVDPTDSKAGGKLEYEGPFTVTSTAANTKVVIQAAAQYANGSYSAVVKADIAFYNSSVSGSNGDVEDGTYYSKIALWNETADKESMGDEAFANNRQALMKVEGDKVTVEAATNPVTIYGLKSGLQDIRFTDSDIKLISTENETADGYGEYISKFTFEFGAEKLEGDELYLDVEVYVPAMGSWTAARLKLDLSELEYTTDTTLQTNASVSNAGSIESDAVDFKDETTGVLIEAEENVFENDTEFKISHVTEGDLLLAAKNALENTCTGYELYDVEAVYADINVNPEGQAYVKFPVLEDVDASKVIIYRIVDTDTPAYADKTELEFTLSADGKYYVIKVKEFGLFAITYQKEIVNDVMVETPYQEVTAQVPAVKKSDITGHWAEAIIKEAIEKGIMSGIGNGDFAPNQWTTRGMFLTALGRMEGVQQGMYQGNKYYDVTEKDYFYTYVAWAIANKVANGVSDNQFAPGENVTREQMATILYNYAKAKDYTFEGEMKSFTDADSISGWAKEAVEAMVKAGIMNGRANGSFDAKGNATRAEVATVLVNFANKYMNN